MFIGREAELNSLDKLYDKRCFQFVVIHGKKRVGKTSLISEFVKDKSNLLFMSQEYDNITSLNIFSQKVYTHYNLTGLPNFTCWNSALEFLAVKAQYERLVLVFDEVNWLCSADKSFVSVLQNIIEQKFVNSNIFLILCSSDASFLQKNIFAPKSVLYGRLTSQIELLPFDYFESINFFPSFRLDEKIAAYGILGGIPQYMQIFNDKYPFKTNLINEVLNKNCFLYEEPRNILKDEVREPIIYNAILASIANGADRISKISQITGLHSDKCAKYIHTLITADILEKITPLGEIAERKSIYKIKNKFMSFWYRFIYENAELVEQNMGEVLYEEIIKENLFDYINKNVFRDICTQYLHIQNAKHLLPFTFTKIGYWWGLSRKRIPVDIDILAYRDKEALFCNCLWNDQPADLPEIKSFLDKGGLITKYKKVTFVFFSKNGFTEIVKKVAEKTKDIILIDINEW